MKRRACMAVSEVFGTMLMLLIAVSLFSVVYISVFLMFGAPVTPVANIIGTITPNDNEIYDIILEHRGGQILYNSTTEILITLGGLQTRYALSDVLIDTNNNSIWNLGERAVIREENISDVSVELSVIDLKSNGMITQNIIQQGKRILSPQINTHHATNITDTTARLHLSYDFRQFTGIVQFKYRVLGSTTWVFLPPTENLSGKGDASVELIGLNKDYWYEFQGLLNFSSGTIHGNILSFLTSTLPLTTTIQWTYPYTLVCSTQFHINASGDSGLDNVTLYYRYSPVNNSWEQGNNWTIWDNPENPTTNYTGQWSWNFNIPNETGYYEFYSMGQYLYQKEPFDGKPEARAYITYQSVINTHVDAISPEHISADTYLITVSNTGVIPNNVSLYYRQGNPSVNWYNTSYSYRRLISIDRSMVASNLFHFPVLLNISNTSFIDHCKTDGTDICFVDYANNITRYPHNIESYYPNTGTFVVWVNVSTLSGFANSSFWMYYGNATHQDHNTETAVWNNDFLTVMHLNESGGSGTVFADATVYQHNGVLDETSGSAQMGVTGKIGPAIRFDGGGSIIKDADAIYLNGLTAFTVSAWVKSDKTNVDNGFLNGHEPNGQDRYLGIRYDKKGASGKGSNLLKAGVTVNSNEEQIESAQNTQTSSWQYVVFCWSSGGQLALYLDGEKTVPTYVDSATGAVEDIQEFIIGKGAKDQGAKGWDGLIDEVRVSQVQRSDGWIQTCYMNQMYPHTFASLHQEEPYYSNQSTQWMRYGALETLPPWEWLFDFPGGPGFYEFTSIGQKEGYLPEQFPLVPDAFCIKE